MANIITFRGSERVASRHGSRQDGQPSGEIVIFPGVRIERWSDAHPVGKPSAKRRSVKAQRDVLEIE